MKPKILGLRERVRYKEMEGMIDWVDHEYVVIALQTEPGKEYPRICVFKENFDKVQQLREDD